MSPRTASLLASVALLSLVASCAGEKEPGTSPTSERASAAPAATRGLDVSADVTVMESFPVQLRGRLTVENPTGDTIVFDVGGCPIFLRVYRTQDGGPVWDQGNGAICTMILRTVSLEPGAVEVFETPTVGAREILGADLPDGTYRTAVYLAFAGDGEREAEAGTVELAVPR